MEGGGEQKMSDKFFNEDDQEQEQDTIALGDEEFTTEELEELVGKAKALTEFEEKQGQSWDEVTKSWGKRGERIGELKKQLEEYEKKQEEEEKPPEQLNQEQIEKQIKAEAKKYGFVLKDDFETEVQGIYNKLREGEKILNRTKRVIKDNAKKGYPKVKEEELLKYMNDPANPADPEKAYKLMFEKEIREVDEKKLGSIKKPGMQTNDKPTAGGKEFTPPKVTKENLSQVLRDHFRQGGE